MTTDMGRYWWTIWIKVAVLAVVLLLAYNFVSGIVQDTVGPYLLEEPRQEQTDGEEDMVQKLVGKVENTFGVQIDYENFIFDFANEYAQKMMEQSDEEHHVISEPLSE